MLIGGSDLGDRVSLPNLPPPTGGASFFVFRLTSLVWGFSNFALLLPYA